MYSFNLDQLNLSPENILVYLRKSRTDDPMMTVEEVLAKHETILNEWVERNLTAPIPEENRYREIVSGETIADRPEIQKVLKLIESPKIKGILTVEVQRLSRGDLEDAGRLIKLLRYTNTLVITPQKIYDLRDEYDRDGFERELKRGNEFLEYQKKIMNRGRLLSVSQGNYIGSQPPFGYDKAWITEGKRKCPTLAINEPQADTVRLIFDMYANQGIGMTNICRHLDSLGIAPPRGKYWSPNALKDTLSNIHYLGKVKWNWRKTVTVVEDSEIVKTRPKSKMDDMLIYDGKHEAIITEEVFNKAQDRMGNTPRTKAKNKVRNPLAGLVYCHCGRSMSLRTYKKQDGSERCSPRLLCDGQVHCHTGSCTYDEMEREVIGILKSSIEDFEVRINNDNGDAIKLHERLLKSLEKKLQELESRELSQWEQQSHPDPEQRMPPDIFRRLNEKLQKEKEEVKAAIKKAQENMPDPVDYAERLNRFQEALNALLDPNKSAEQKNRLLKACIERITYRREKPVREQSQKEYVYNKETKKSSTKSPLKVGGSWTNPPIELDVKLNV